MGVVIGFDRTDMPTSFEVLAICKGSDITDGAFIKMRGGNTRTVPPACFFFIVKSDIDVFVWFVNQTKKFYICR